MVYLWVRIEINILSFIPLVLFLDQSYNDRNIKYFLIQRVSSSLFLFFSLLHYLKIIGSIYLLVLIIFLKMGRFPFNHWYINVLKNLHWLGGFILISTQKILLYFYLYNLVIRINREGDGLIIIIYLLIVIRIFKRLIILFSNNNLKILIGRSSINQIRWIIMLIFINWEIWVRYYFIYTLILFIILRLFITRGIKYLKDLYNVRILFKLILFFLIVLIIRIPPIIIFYMKSIGRFIILKNNIKFIVYLFIIFSVGIIFYYMKIFISSIFIISQIYKIELIFKVENKNNLILWVVVLLRTYIYYWIILI